MPKQPVFAIPTCRLRDVGATLEAYDRHFTSNGHELPLWVFDDSGPALQRQYRSHLDGVSTHNPIFYVGPEQKAAFKHALGEQLGDPRLTQLVHQLLRPSYGGNRNFTLLYSLGAHLVSADDDMRPYALMEEEARPLSPDEICRGKLVHVSSAPAGSSTFDILAAFEEVLGKRVDQLPSYYARGELLVDTAMDLETNATKGLSRDNSLLLQHGEVSDSAVVRMAQTFRSGTNDIDALDFVDMFLDDPAQLELETLSQVYVLTSFRPAVTNKNWRMDCGVAGYDNSDGLPPFFPTRLRFEDYPYRLWVQQAGIVAAHVPAAQNHTKSLYMRNPLASEVLNEEIANLLKRKILRSVSGLNSLGVVFEYDGEVTCEDADVILDKVQGLRQRVSRAAEKSSLLPRVQELERFGASLDSVFFGFERDFFQYNLRRALRETVAAIKSTFQLWPAVLEICERMTRNNQLPFVTVGNRS